MAAEPKLAWPCPLASFLHPGTRAPVLRKHLQSHAPCCVLTGSGKLAAAAQPLAPPCALSDRRSTRCSSTVAPRLLHVLVLLSSTAAYPSAVSSSRSIPIRSLCSCDWWKEKNSTN